MEAVRVTLQLAITATGILLVTGVPLAWWLTRSNSKVVPLVRAATAMPLVLPPTVLGFYLLMLLGPDGPFGRPLEALGGPRLVFSFPGIVIGVVLHSLPFVVQPLENAFRAIPARLLDAAATMGACPFDRFRTIALPLARPGIFVAGILGFAHAVGEFGVVLMIGGSIPGHTEVLSVALFREVEALNYGRAHAMAAALLAFALLVMLAVERMGRRPRPR